MSEWLKNVSSQPEGGSCKYGFMRLTDFTHCLGIEAVRREKYEAGPQTYYVCGLDIVQVLCNKLIIIGLFYTFHSFLWHLEITITLIIHTRVHTYKLSSFFLKSFNNNNYPHVHIGGSAQITVKVSPNVSLSDKNSYVTDHCGSKCIGGWYFVYVPPYNTPRLGKCIAYHQMRQIGKIFDDSARLVHAEKGEAKILLEKSVIFVCYINILESYLKWVLKCLHSQE